MTRPSRKAPAGESEVHPLPPVEKVEDFAAAFRWVADRAAAATPPPVVEVWREGWLLSAMLEDIYRGTWRLSHPEIDAAIEQAAALANGHPAARLALGATLEAGR